MKHWILTITILIACSQIISAQADSNKTFLASRGTWKYPVSKGFILENNLGYNGNRTVIFISDSAATVNAIFAGVVVLVNKYDDAYMVVIKYGDYFIGYSNMGSCIVKKGDKIKAGDIIGYVGKDLDDRYGVDMILSNRDGDIDASFWFSSDLPAKSFQ